MDALDVAALDDAPPLEPDPSIWPANLSALREQQPDLACRIEATPLPPHWRPVAGLDGFPTWRIEPPGAPPAWLADTAAPQTRAGALLRLEELSERNPALPTIAAGAELKLLLERLAPYQAVYVFEEDATRLAAVLRTIAVDQAVRAGRCILVPAGREGAFLEETLDRFPGLLPPGMLIALPGVAASRLAQLRDLCASAARSAEDARSRRIQSCAHLPAEPSARAPDGVRVALVALGPNPLTHHLAEELERAASGLGWKSCACVMRGPRTAHVLPHCERLAEARAALAVCIEHGPAVLPLRPGRIVARWHLQARAVPERLPDDDTLHLAASPYVARALRAAGLSEQRLLEFHWACPTTPVEAAPWSPASKTVALVADLPDARAAACRIEQPTHKQLWTRVHQLAAEAWQTPLIGQPAALLARAERASGIELGEQILRDRFLRLIEHALIPAVVLERILGLLCEAAFTVVTIGAGWQRCTAESFQRLAPSFQQLPAQALTTPILAAVCAGSLDPLGPGLFHAAALGWPLLLHHPGGGSPAARLAGILQPGQHCDIFTSSAELRAALDALRAHPQRTQRRCARVRTYLAERHSYGQRLKNLVRQLDLPWAPSAP